LLALRLSSLARANDAPAEIGEKARPLVRLLKQGFPVPDGLCISRRVLDTALATANIRAADAARDAAVAAAARELIATCQLPDEIVAAVSAFQAEYSSSAFAVRSSGTCEDLGDASFAGLYRTVLGPRSVDEILSAIRACWQSTFERTVLDYIANRRIDASDLSLAVLIQPLIAAEKSGVLFSVDPISGDDTVMLIEAAFGLGEVLVSGQVSPDRYRYNWYSSTETEREIANKSIALFAGQSEPQPLPPGRADAPVLSKDEVAQLAALGLRAQRDAGRPVDIEWAIAGGELWLLQRRPITRVAFAGMKDEWTTADFRDGGVSSGVCTPFMSSLYESVFATSLPRYFDQLGLKGAPAIWYRNFFARPYWNMGAAKARVRLLPGHTDASFEEGLGIAAREGSSSVKTRLTPRTLVAGLRAIFALESSCRRQLRDAPEFKKRQNARLAELDAVDPHALSSSELYAWYERFLREEYFHNEATYFNFIYDNSNLTSQFREAFLKTRSTVSYPLLLGGLAGVSHLAPSFALWTLSREIRAKADWLDYWNRHSVRELIAAWRASVRDHGIDAFARLVHACRHHSTRELDLTVPRFDEDPSLLAETLKRNLALDDSADPRLQGETQRLAAAKEQARFIAELKPRARSRMAKRLNQVRQFLWWREELRDLSTQYYHHVRRFTLAVGRTLARSGVLANADDIFFLSMHEIFDATSGRTPPEAVAARVARNRAYYESFSAYEIPNEIGLARAEEPQMPVPEGARVLRGVACSSGIVRARARVIADIFDADRIEPGDILITRCTDPGWTPKFSMLAGVATETGGLLSHAAVISREYGIPAVLAVNGLLRGVTDGQTVILDGTAGTLTLDV
jgi:pyruvate,water dikinase